MIVSIALPTYDGARYLAEQLQSFVDQRRRPDEVVIADDHSTDDTLAIARRFAATAPFAVRVLPGEGRLGCNANFARAIAACDGEIIALSDQDDVWLATHVERLAAPIEADPHVGLVISNSTYVDETLRPIGTTLFAAERFGPADLARVQRGPQFREWCRHHVVAGHGLAFRAGLRDVILPFGVQTYDHWLSIVCAACARVELIEEPLALHRHHERQAVANREVSLAEHARANASVSTGHFAAQAASWRALDARLNAFADRWIEADVSTVLRGRAELLDRRGAIRNGGHAARIAKAMATLLAGRYHRYGRGWLTFARDVRG